MKTLASLFLLLSSGLAQVADKANSGYKTPEGRQAVAKGLIAPDRDNRPSVAHAAVTAATAPQATAGRSMAPMTTTSLVAVLPSNLRQPKKAA